MLMMNADQLLLSRCICHFLINCAGVWGLMYHSTSIGILRQLVLLGSCALNGGIAYFFMVEGGQLLMMSQQGFLIPGWEMRRKCFMGNIAAAASESYQG
ncbi:hypothetical protein ACSQ67_013958 [Phaseolus vulgaris]